MKSDKNKFIHSTNYKNLKDEKEKTINEVVSEIEKTNLTTLKKLMDIKDINVMGGFPSVDELMDDLDS